MKVWINADDFGLTKSCTDAILYCFNNHLITTTTMVVNSKFSSYAFEKIKETEYIDRVGLHINLTEGKPLTKSISKNTKFCDEKGNFTGFERRYVRLTKTDKMDVYNEIEAQFDEFLRSGLQINHVDSHHHVHNSFRILPILVKVMRKKNIKFLRLARNTGKISFIKRLYKMFFNARIKKYSYSKYMGSFYDYELTNKNENKVFEIMIHPDFNNAGNIIDRENGDYENPKGPLLSNFGVKNIL